MALARCNFAVQDGLGNIVNGAAIEVRSEVTGLLASVFSDRAGAVPLGNPFTAADGSDAGFHVVGGAYKIVATLGAFTRTWRYNGIGLASEFDVDQLSAALATSFMLTLLDDSTAAEARITLGIGVEVIDFRFRRTRALARQGNAFTLT
jgi:hypothetical protein